MDFMGFFRFWGWGAIDSLSSDADNFIESYRWRQVSGISVNLSDSNMEIATFVAPLVDVDETLVFELQVTDSVGNVVADTVDILVTNVSVTALGVVLGSDKVSPLQQGELLSLVAQGQGGSGGGYEYLMQVRSIGESSNGPWIVLQDFNANNTLVWDTTTFAGKYKIQVLAREVGNLAVEVKDNLTYWVNSPSPVTHVDLVNNTAKIVTAGSSVILDAIAQGGSGAIDYLYQVKNTALQADWITLQGYSAFQDFVWDTAAYQGKNILRVRARNSGSNDFWAQDKITVWVNSANAVTSVTLAPNVFSPQLSGTAVNIGTDILGGNGNVEYQFSVKDTQGLEEWVVAQGWSSAASLNWDTLGLFGKYRIRVESRNSGSGDKAIVDTITYWLNSDNSVSDVTLQLDQVSPMVAGSLVNLSATPVGGSGSFEYQFRVKGTDAGDAWSVLRDFDTSPTLQINSASFLGKNIFQVRARNQGTLDQYAKARTAVWVNQINPITAVGLSAANTNVIWGDTINFDMTFTGGDGSYYMTKELKRPGEGGYEGNGFYQAGAATQFSFDVGGMLPGVYRMRVLARNAITDKPVKSVSVKFTVSANPAPEWQTGGGNSGNIQSCSVYQCACTVFNSCDVDLDDPSIFGY